MKVALIHFLNSTQQKTKMSPKKKQKLAKEPKICTPNVQLKDPTFGGWEVLYVAKRKKRSFVVFVLPCIE